MLAVLAPGQGAQKPGMLTDWLELPGAESFFRRAGEIAGAEVLDTVRAVLGSGGNLEASARALFVHPNTVRYRLKRVLDITGLSATDPRGSWTLQIALALSDLDRSRSLWH